MRIAPLLAFHKRHVQDRQRDLAALSARWIAPRRSKIRSQQSYRVWRRRTTLSLSSRTAFSQHFTHFHDSSKHIAASLATLVCAHPRPHSCKDTSMHALSIATFDSRTQSACEEKLESRESLSERESPRTFWTGRVSWRPRCPFHSYRELCIHSTSISMSVHKTTA